MTRNDLEQILNDKAYLEYCGNLFEYCGINPDNGRHHFIDLNDGHDHEASEKWMLESGHYQIVYEDQISK